MRGIVLAVGVHGRQLRHALVERDRHRGVLQVARHAAFGIAGEVEVEVDRAAPLQIAHVAAGLAEPLHRREAHHHARPLDAGLVAAGAAVAVAPAAGREIDALPAPLAGERAHVLGRHAGLLLLPLRRLRDAVLVAGEIGRPLVEADGVGLHVVLVVETFLDPDVGDRHRHRRRRGRLRREPLARQELRRRVVVRIDVHDLDAELAGSSATAGGPCPPARRRSRRWFPDRRTRTRSCRSSAGSPRPCRRSPTGRRAACGPSDAPRPSTSPPTNRDCGARASCRSRWRSETAPTGSSRCCPRCGASRATRRSRPGRGSASGA